MGTVLTVTGTTALPFFSALSHDTESYNNCRRYQNGQYDFHDIHPSPSTRHADQIRRQRDHPCHRTLP